MPQTEQTDVHPNPKVQQRIEILQSFGDRDFIRDVVDYLRQSPPDEIGRLALHSTILAERTHAALSAILADATAQERQAPKGTARRRAAGRMRERAARELRVVEPLVKQARMRRADQTRRRRAERLLAEVCMDELRLLMHLLYDRKMTGRQAQDELRKRREEGAPLSKRDRAVQILRKVHHDEYKQIRTWLNEGLSEQEITERLTSG